MKKDFVMLKISQLNIENGAIKKDLNVKLELITAHLLNKHIPTGVGLKEKK
jgi:hypothetical protein